MEQEGNGEGAPTIQDTTKANETGDTIFLWKLSKEEDGSEDLTTTRYPDTPPLETLTMGMARRDLFGITTEEMVRKYPLTTTKTNDNPALDIGSERTRNFVKEEAGERQVAADAILHLSIVKMLVNLSRMMVSIELLNGFKVAKDKFATDIRMRDTATKVQERESLAQQDVVIVVLGS